MILEISIALLLGVTAGTLTGLLPGVHINLVSAFLISFSPILLSYATPLSLAIFIISMSIAHTFLDFIPSIYLGAPTEETALSILPGHQLMLQGRGHEAVTHAIAGGLLALPLLIILAPVYISFLPKFYPYFSNSMFFILLLASIYLITKNKRKKLALALFLLSGFLGIAVFNSNIKEPLLPLLSGLFGASTLIESAQQKTQIPQQTITSLSETPLHLKKPFFASLLAVPLCSFLPGLGSSQAAVIGSDILNEERKEEFLTLLGCINTLTMSLSFIVLYTIAKSRTGSAAAISQLLNLNFKTLLIILIAVVVSALIASVLTILISQKFSRYISHISYPKLSILVLFFLTLLVFLFSKTSGLIVFATSTAIGALAISVGIRKSTLMGVIMLNTLVFYWPF